MLLGAQAATDALALALLVLELAVTRLPWLCLHETDIRQSKQKLCLGSMRCSIKHARLQPMSIAGFGASRG